MEGAKLTVEVGAQITDLQSKMVQAGKTVDKFAASGGQSLQKFAKGSNNAAFALQNLGRVAQDAPFGFIGIQNNLNPLLESFQMLKKETGSSGAALKALRSTLMGPAGIGIALSVVSAGILLYQKYSYLLTGTIKDQVTQMDSLNEAMSKGNKEAGKEISNVQLLYEASTNVNVAMGKRNKAANELIELSGGVLKASDRERLKNGELADSIKLVTDNIIENARAKAIAVKIGELEAQKLDAQIKLQRIAGKLANENAGAKTTRFDLGMGQSVTMTAESEIKSNNKRAKSSTDSTNIIIANLTKQQDFLKGFVKDGGFADAIVGDPKKVNAAKTAQTELMGRTKEWFALMRNKQKINTNVDLGGGVKEGDAMQLISKRAMEEAIERLAEVKIETDGFYIYQQQMLAGLEGDFADFFNTILTQGKISFKSLGQAILSEFSQVLSSVVAKKLMGLLANVLTGGGSGAVGGFLKILGFAGGTNSAPGGLAMVGERGPELVNLPRGSQVIPNNKLGGSVQVFIATSYNRGSVIETAYNRATNRTYRVS